MRMQTDGSDIENKPQQEYFHSFWLGVGSLTHSQASECIVGKYCTIVKSTHLFKFIVGQQVEILYVDH